MLRLQRASYVNKHTYSSSVNLHLWPSPQVILVQVPFSVMRDSSDSAAKAPNSNGRSYFL